MNMPRRHFWVHAWAAVLLTCLGLSACLGSPRVQSTPVPLLPSSVVEDQAVQGRLNTDTPAPLPTPIRQSPTPQPSATPTITLTSTPAGIPELLKGFPLFAGAEVDPTGAYAAETIAGLLIHTGRSPGDLDVFYRTELEKTGWTLRYAEGNPAGGFLQEWRKGDSWLTVEYLFLENRPVVQADLRVIDSKKALVVLLGFPLPNGTLVTNAEGSSIELYVPQDYDTTVQYFIKTMHDLRWKVEETKLDARCGSRACLDTAKEAYRQVATLEPTPTADAKRKPVTYQVTMSDRTQARITFLPHRDSTRVFVDVNWKNPHRAWMPIPPYPNGEIQAVKPYVVMFTTPDSLQTVVEHYKKGMSALGWKADPDAIKIDQEYEYHNTWMKRGQYISITLSRSKGVTHGTITCRGCWE